MVNYHDIDDVLRIYRPFFVGVKNYSLKQPQEEQQTRQSLGLQVLLEENTSTAACTTSVDWLIEGLPTCQIVLIHAKGLV